MCSSDLVQSRTLIVLGANGQLGSLLRRVWAKTPLDGWRAVWCARKAGPGIDKVWSPGDPAPCQADAILALWGVVAGAGNLEDNSWLAKSAMNLGRTSGANRVLHCSSAAVYGPGAALREDMKCVPVNSYGAAKLAMEAAIARTHGPEACSMRLANVAGADSLFSAMESGRKIVIDRFPNGQGPKRSYALPSGILRSVGALLEAENLPEVINVAQPGTVAMEDLLSAAGLAIEWREAPEGALAEVVLNTSELQSLTMHETATGPEEILAEVDALR